MKRLIISALILIGIVSAPLAVTTPTFAAINAQEQACKGTGGSWDGTSCTGNTATPDLPTIIKTIVNTLLFVIGAVAVIMIIVGAFRYVTSGGNSSSVTAAKNTIIYAVIGLIIAIVAYAIVHFVIQTFIK